MHAHSVTRPNYLMRLWYLDATDANSRHQLHWALCKADTWDLIVSFVQLCCKTIWPRRLFFATMISLLDFLKTARERVESLEILSNKGKRKSLKGMISRISGKKDVHLDIQWKLPVNLPGGWGYFLIRGYWGCAARWGRIFMTGLTIMGSRFQ